MRQSPQARRENAARAQRRQQARAGGGMPFPRAADDRLLLPRRPGHVTGFDP